MKETLFCVLIIALYFCTSLWGQADASEHQKYWPYWRGPLNTGEAPLGNPPIEWSETKNVLWKTEIPGRGLSTPVVWGDQMFLTTAISTDRVVDEGTFLAREKATVGTKGDSGRYKKQQHFYQFVVLAIDCQTGDVLWQKTVLEDFPNEPRHHKDTSLASGSCVTDGECVIATFGSMGFYCFDLSGKLLWQKDLGNMKTRYTFGEGCTPALFQNDVVVTWDHEGDSRLFVLDKKTGDVIWQKPRDERTNWSTPLVVSEMGKAQIVVGGLQKCLGYDLRTGDILWESDGLTLSVIPSPVYDDGVVYLTSGFRGSALQAVDLRKARGVITNTKAVLWTHDKNTPYIASPLLLEGKLYYIDYTKPSLTCADTKTGHLYYAEQKLDGIRSIYASLVGAADRLYITGRRGVFNVIKHGPSFEVIAKNKLDDNFDASPVIVGNKLYLRGWKSLYCIANK